MAPMKNVPSLTPQQRTDLVAYLDGELDEAAAVQVEEVLAANPAARREVEMLSRTFELLDELPRPKASEEFTERTLTLIKIGENAEQSHGQEVSPRMRGGAVVAGWISALAIAAVIGLFSTFRSPSINSDQLVRDLPVVQNVEMYLDAKDIEFVQQLERMGLFDESQRTSEP